MTHLTNAPDVPGPLVTATALILAFLVLFGVLFFLALGWARRTDRAEEDA